MAKILVSYFRSDEVSVNDTLCFFDSFFKELREAGNDVLAINNAYYGIFNPNRTNNEKIRAYLLSEAIKFSPELIITFNHRILQDILDEFKDIPVVIYDGDELRYFSDLEVIKENIDRYKVFSIVKDWRQDYLDFGFKENQIFYLPPGTSVKKDLNLPVTMNISFLGQRRFFLSTKLTDAIKKGQELDKFYSTYKEFLSTKKYDYEKLYKKNTAYSTDLDLSDADLWPLFDQSYLIFANLLDLGLHLGGHESGWRDIVDFIPQIAITHNKAKIFSLSENQDFYNSSKISLCPMHPQANGKGYSWRCYDIMASNACLVSSYSSELREATKNFVNLPMFDTPYEARTICKDLLENESKRKEIVLASQDFIEQNGRWVDRIKKMEQILDLKLICPNHKGSFKKLTWNATLAEKMSQQRKTLTEEKMPKHIKYYKLLNLGKRIQSKMVNPWLLLTLFLTVCVNSIFLFEIKIGLFDGYFAETILKSLVFIFSSVALLSIGLFEVCIIYKFGYKVLKKLLS